MKKKRNVMAGQTWFDRDGQYSVLAVANGYAMCLRDWQQMPWLRSLDEINANSALKDAGEEQELSDREYSVMQRLAAGKNINKIAEHMGLSPSTVSTYRSRILRKLGVNSNAELALFVANAARA